MKENIVVLPSNMTNMATQSSEARKIKVRDGNFKGLQKASMDTVTVQKPLEQPTPVAEFEGITLRQEKPVTTPYSFERKPEDTPKQVSTDVVPDIKAPSNLGDVSLRLRKMAVTSNPDSYKGKLLLYTVSKLDDLDKQVSSLKESISSDNAVLEKLEAAKSIEDRDLRKLSGVTEAVTDSTYAGLEIHTDRSSDEDPMALANIELSNIRDGLANIKAILESVKARIDKLNDKCNEIKLKIAKTETAINNLLQSKVDLCNKVLTDKLPAAEEADRLTAARKQQENNFRKADGEYAANIEMLIGKFEFADSKDETNPFNQLREEQTGSGRAA